MSFFAYVSLCVVYVCVCMSTCVWTHGVCMCVESWSWDQESSSNALPIATGASLNWELASSSYSTYSGCSRNPLHPASPPWNYRKTTTPTMHLHVCWVGGGGLNPRPCICESSALITELSFQPLLPSFNLICQIIPKAYSHRVMPNHLTIIVSLQNCDSESRMHSNPWLCDTPSTPVWTELRFLYVCPGSLIYPKISSRGYLWDEALGLGKDPLLAGVIMEDPLGNKAVTTWQNTKYSCKIPTVFECAQQYTEK